MTLRQRASAVLASLALRLLRWAYRLDHPDAYTLNLWAMQLRVEALSTNLGSTMLPALYNFSTAVKDAAAALGRYVEVVREQQEQEAARQAQEAQA